MKILERMRGERERLLMAFSKVEECEMVTRVGRKFGEDYKDEGVVLELDS
jgi:hypothetical protein